MSGALPPTPTPFHRVEDERTWECGPGGRAYWVSNERMRRMGYPVDGPTLADCAARLRALAGSRLGVAQAGYVTVEASELEYIAAELEAVARP